MAIILFWMRKVKGLNPICQIKYIHYDRRLMGIWSSRLDLFAIIIQDAGNRAVQIVFGAAVFYLLAFFI